MPERIRRVPALTNTFSGVAGEARVAAELVRGGFRVAKPLWTDDEADLLVLMRTDGALLPIVVQVKSVQFLPDSQGQLAHRRQNQPISFATPYRAEGCDAGVESALGNREPVWK
jgi:hypothetical protein